jgi:hypothetical protein
MTNINNKEGIRVPIDNSFFTNEIDNIINSKKDRGSIRIGRFINSIFPNKFTNAEIEDFVNIVRNKNVDKYEFKIISGDDIKKYYKVENCADYDPKKGRYSVMGTLGNSCMMNKDEVSSNIFDIYTKNPDVCKMLIMLNNGELVARALLWNVHCEVLEGPKVGEEFEGEFLDRIYYQHSWMVKSMRDYAESKGYITKYYGGLSFEANTEQRYTLKDGKFYKLNMRVPIKKIFYKSFPYLDTFIYYDVKNGDLNNYKKDGFKLFSIDGSYSSSGGLGNRIRNNIRRFK